MVIMERGRKKQTLAATRGILVLVHLTQNYRKHHKLLQPYFCTHLHWQEVSISLCYMLQNNNYLRLQSTNSKMLKCILSPQMSEITQDQPPRYYTQKILVFIHFYFSKFVFDENVLIAQVCRVQGWTKAEDTQWSDPAYLYPSTSHFPTYIITPLYKRRYFYRTSTYKCHVFISGLFCLMPPSSSYFSTYDSILFYC